MTPAKAGCALTVLGFDFTLQANALHGWKGHLPGLKNFDVDGWICRFSGGSRSGSSDPRPMYNKVCILPPYFLARMLHMVYSMYPESLNDGRLYLARPSSFDAIMDETGIGDLITAPVDAMGGRESLSFKSLRSISASILPYVHICKSFLSDAHKSQAMACAQVGHASPGDTTSRYTCKKVEFDDTPPCYPPQIITLDHLFRMVVSPTAKRKRA